MPHTPRWIPSGRPLVEVTTRTFQARYLLRPSRTTNEIIVGVVGRAQRMYGMEICAFVFMSNHYHMLLVPEDARQLAKFMEYVNGQIAREINRATAWKAKVWARRFDPILVSDEPEVQRARFRYLLSHGVKEGLADHPARWIGASSVDAWLHGSPIVGYWFDRTRETRARRRGKVFDRLAFATRETVRLSPLPCWRAEGVDEAEIRREIVEMVDYLVELGRLERKLAGKGAASPRSLLGLPADHRPESPARSPRPPVHCRSKTARRRLRDARSAFLERYRQAAKALRGGDRQARFPEGSFPPALPFVELEQVEGLRA